MGVANGWLCCFPWQMSHSKSVETTLIPVDFTSCLPRLKPALKQKKQLKC